MSDVLLGSTPDSKAERDAVHVAIIPMEASEKLRPGQRVGIVGEKLAGPLGKVVGVVDPFLRASVLKGERFWLFLLPNTVTGMRHHWAHPMFPDVPVVEEGDKAAAEKWLREQCETLGCRFDDLVSDDSELVTGGWLITDMNETARDHWYDIKDEFWKQRAIYTGKDIAEDDRGCFSCSC